MRAKQKARDEVDKGFLGLALNTKDRIYESAFIELVRKNAEKFLGHLKE